MKKAYLFFWLTLMALATWTPQAGAFSALYDSNCAGCHGATQTCNGCHAHGVHSDSTKSNINLVGATDKMTYAPGEMVSVTINGGYRGGWIRTVLYDQAMIELARSTGTVAPGTSAPSGGPPYPVTLTAPAPSAAGTYVWSVAWYGNQSDSGGAAFGPNWTPDTANAGHGREVVNTNSFTVAATPVPTPSIALDPPAQDFGNVVIGAAAVKTSTVTNTGTADLNVNGIALCSGTSDEFSWSPSAPFTIAPGGSTVLSVSYAPTDAGADTGCLNISSNDSATNPAVLNLSGTGVATPPLTDFDFDILKFKASKYSKVVVNKGKHLGTAVKFEFKIFNEGTETATSRATLVGMQNGQEIYRKTINVSTLPGRPRMYMFPWYMPVARGDIAWTATLEDNDADVDQATAITTVRK